VCADFQGMPRRHMFDPVVTIFFLEKEQKRKRRM